MGIMNNFDLINRPTYTNQFYRTVGTVIIQSVFLMLVKNSKQVHAILDKTYESNTIDLFLNIFIKFYDCMAT
ncbi:hypothetical protein WA026_006103 [Henosepilachna vigintioctopunctata]|uniref:Uncharacterized protein n=1 Tax=Henosepilachna vigintioctopunctata TaxID=420089 RepID=A0AAW1TJY0_9CUCU